jgi:hypothetical protein
MVVELGNQVLRSYSQGFFWGFLYLGTYSARESDWSGKASRYTVGSIVRSFGTPEVPNSKNKFHGFWLGKFSAQGTSWSLAPLPGYCPCRSTLIPVNSRGEDFPYTFTPMPLGPLPSNYGRPWGECPFWYFAKQKTLTDNLC